MPVSRLDAAVRSHHRHRRGTGDPAGRSRWKLPTVLLVAVILVAGAVVVGAWKFASKAPSGCAGPTVTASVLTEPDVSPVFASLARQWNGTGPEAGGRCVAISVVSKASSQVAAALGPAWDPARDGVRPDAWLPDSSLWLSVAGVRTDAAGLLPKQTTSVATSPIVLAVRQDVVQALGWPQKDLGWNEVLGAFATPAVWPQVGHPEWAALRMGLTDPASSTTGIAGVMTLLDRNATGQVSDAQLMASLNFTHVIGAVTPDTAAYFTAAGAATKGPLSIVAAFPALERNVASYDTSGTSTPLVPIYSPDKPVVADYPFTILDATWVSAPARGAVEQFQRYLLGDEAQNALASQGLRGPDRTIRDAGALPTSHGFKADTATPRPNPGPAALSALIAQWAALQRQSDIVAVLDTSGSMSSVVPGTGKTRLQLLQQTAIQGFALLPSQTNIGLWEFSVRPGSNNEYRKLVPFGPLAGNVGSVPRKQALSTAVQGMRPQGNTPLYDTVYAAFHEAQSHWKANNTNAVLLITDGANEFNGGLTLPQLLTKLAQGQRADRPVQVIAIAVGPEADAASLQKISGATGGRTFVVRDPAKALQTLILAFAGRLQ